LDECSLVSGDWIRTSDLLSAILGRSCRFEEALDREPDRSRRERSRPTSCRNRYRTEGVLRGAKARGQGVGVLNATLTDELWAALTQRIDAHSMTDYRNLTAALSPKETVEGKAEKV